MGLLELILVSARHYWPLLATTVIVSAVLRIRYRRHLRDIPGPLLASISDLWLIQHYCRRRGIYEYALHRKYNSPLLRLGPNTVSVADLEASRIIYGWKPVFKKSRLYISQHQTSVAGETISNVSAEMDEEKHGRIRRPIASAYAMTTIIQYEPLVDSSSLAFMEVMEKQYARTGAECDLSKWLQMYAFDVIGEMTFGRRFGFLEAGEDVENMMYHTGRAMDWIGMVGQAPNIDEWLRLKVFGKLRTLFGLSNNVVGFSAREVRDFLRRQDETPTFMSKFLTAREKHPEMFSEPQLIEFANTNVGGGSDTTAIALRELVYRFLIDQSSLERFLDEIKVVLQERVDDHNEPISYKEASGMPYFQACIKEVLRIHSPLGQMLPRVVPKGGVVLCGHFLPEGTIVGSNCWSVHRDKSFYGEDADEYKPERWLDPDTAKVQRMENASLAFGGGPRVCIGRNIAMLEINKFIPELFRRFELTLVDPRRYTLLPGWLVLQRGLDVTLTRRDLNTQAS